MTTELLERAYVQEGRSGDDIARELGYSRQHINNLLKRWGVRRRTVSEARLLAVERGKIRGHQRVHVNLALFEEWTPGMAYVPGVIATDGCVRAADTDPRTGRRVTPAVSISQKEPELLQKVLALMGCDARVRFRKNGTRGVHYVTISGQALVDELLAFGITPRKSRTLGFPEVPSECLRHFLRGCWDGDGLVERLRPLGLAPRTIHVDARRPGREAYQIRLHGRRALAFGHFLYNGVPRSQLLERKVRVFEDAAAVAGARQKRTPISP